MDRLVPPLSLKWKKLIALAGALVAAAWLLVWVRPQRFLPLRFQSDPTLDASFSAITDDFRKIVVLMDGSDSLDDAVRARCIFAGRQIFWRKQRAVEELKGRLAGQ